MKKMITTIIVLFSVVLLAVLFYFFVGKPKIAEKITWGVNFSQKHTENLGLNWKETYLAIIEDLAAKNIKLLVPWDWVNGERDDYFFNDVDWQVDEAEKHNVKLIMVIGMKTGRWPECHIPDWAKTLPKEDLEAEVLKYLEQMVSRYKDSDAVIAWQVENEPFFPFGQCPKIDKKFVEKEVELVKSLDNQKRPIIISDTGEFSLWFKPAQIGDIVGTTMYKKVWSKELGIYFPAPFPSVFYWRKAELVKTLFGKKTIGVELQAEPWGPVLLYNLSLEEQKKTMDLKQFQYNTEFAKRTGLDTFYFWGAEWWYWLKTRHNDFTIWEEAKKLFQ